VSNRERSASTVNTFSSLYNCGFFLSLETLGIIRWVGVVGVVGVVGFVVRDSDMGDGRRADYFIESKHSMAINS